jgi:hypothetical protein
MLFLSQLSDFRWEVSDPLFLDRVLLFIVSKTELNALGLTLFADNLWL